MSVAENCEACRFFCYRDNPTGAGGECHRRAPRVHSLDKPDWVWPGVSGQDWCGEFQLRSDLARQAMALWVAGRNADQ